MSKINIDQTLEEIMASNTDRFTGLRKTRNGRVMLRRYRGDGDEGGRGRGRGGGRDPYRREGKQRYNSYNNRAGGGRSYNDYYDRYTKQTTTAYDSYRSENRYTQARRAFRYRDTRGSMNDEGIKLITSSHVIKMHVSNLDFGVTQGDMKELFSSIGKLKHVALHYDKNGRSQGTCEIIFERKTDAIKAFNQYNGVPLDGRPMNLELMGEPMVNQRAEQRPESQQPRGRMNDAYDQGAYSSRGGGGGGSGGRRREDRIIPNAEDLDKELDAYLMAGSKK